MLNHQHSNQGYLSQHPPKHSLIRNDESKPHMPRFNTQNFWLRHRSRSSFVSRATTHHQVSSLNFAYIDGQWDYCGITTLYLSLDDSLPRGRVDVESINSIKNSSLDKIKESILFKDKKEKKNELLTREIVLHLRGGCGMKILNAQVSTVIPVHSITKTQQSPLISQLKMKGFEKNMSSTDELINKTTAEIKSINHNNMTETFLKCFKMKDLETIQLLHHDPLAKVLTKPASTFTPMDYIPPKTKLNTKNDRRYDSLENTHIDNKKGIKVNTKKKSLLFERNGRYEADSQWVRGATGMTHALRSKSIASNFGELCISFQPDYHCHMDNKKNHDIDYRDNINIHPKSNKNSTKNNFMVSDSTPWKETRWKLWKEQIKEVWRKDMVQCGTFGSFPGVHGKFTKDLRMKLNDRGGERRETRLELVASKLADASCSYFKMNSQKKIVNKISGECKETDVVNCESVDVGMNNEKKSPISSLNFMEKNDEDRAIWPMAVKVTIHYRIYDIQKGAIHLGGIHFICPSPLDTTISTPHVYTTTGITGDHQGTRCWIPTVDSASSKHRCTHELTITVTSKRSYGLWPVGFGENFGCNGVLLHSFPSCLQEYVVNNTINYKSDNYEGSQDHQNNVKISNEMKNENLMTIEKIKNKRLMDVSNKIKEMLGSFLFCFISKLRQNSVITHEAVQYNNDKSINYNSEVEEESFYPTLATAVWTTSSWSRCPSRSLGFAIGPFKVLYDVEYYFPDKYNNNKSDGINKEDEEKSDDRRHKNTIKFKGYDDKVNSMYFNEVLEKGEGIRQLYFAPLDERHYLHSRVVMIISTPNTRGHGHIVSILPIDLTNYDGKLYHRHYATTSVRERRRMIKECIIGSTTGITSRALSLMRDILGLPLFRTVSYTQIWIPLAIDGGASCGVLHACPDVQCNPFLGGSIMDSRLLHPLGHRLPFYSGGKVLQFLQARCAVRGWITAALPLGGSDDIGNGYIHTLFESFIMSLYERAHGEFGAGGGRCSFFFSERYSTLSGLNSRNLDFLQSLINVEDDDLHGEERNSEQLWRSAANGTESHTSSLDEFSIRQLLNKDILEALERVDKGVPKPSMGWLGSHLSATFLSSNSTSSSAIGCGALELVHPIGGHVYRTIKCNSLRRIIEGRAGSSNFTRVMRIAFISALLEDIGEEFVEIPEVKHDIELVNIVDDGRIKSNFVVCIDELIKKGGMTHGSFTRTLRVISGPSREKYLRGNLVDIVSGDLDHIRRNGLIEPEGFPNSFVHGASGLYLRVGSHVENACVNSEQKVSTLALKGTHLHVIAEPVIPEGGIAFGGCITIRVIENEGQCKEIERTILSDGSRSDWHPIVLTAKEVTSAKQQSAASGTVEGSSANNNTNCSNFNDSEVSILKRVHDSASNSLDPFSINHLHKGGYQALELVRLTNRSPLLWIRMDPQGLYDGRYSISLPDACLAEQLFHDSESGSQVEALRALGERPLRIQGSVRINSVYDVPVPELPVRLLADCLRGSVALHADLPHNPAVRCQAALTIAQWQNNQAPNSKDAIGKCSWVGLNILIQYIKERNLNHDCMSVKYSRVTLKKQLKFNGNSSTPEQATIDSAEYEYFDTIADRENRVVATNEALHVEFEEDEEYRVISSVITSIASCRAKDGLSPPLILKFLESILQGRNESSTNNIFSLEEENLIRSRKLKHKANSISYGKTLNDKVEFSEHLDELPYESSSLIANKLLSLCNINIRPTVLNDPTTGKQISSEAEHPCERLINICHCWLEWDLYREDTRTIKEVEILSGLGGHCFSTVSSCAIVALCSLILLKENISTIIKSSPSNENKKVCVRKSLDIHFFIDIFDYRPMRSDLTRAAAAHAVTCMFCAADKFVEGNPQPIGLLNALEFLLEKILECTSSPGLRHTLASLMLDVCTGKICPMNRRAYFGGINDLITSASNFFNGPLGASYGSNNGSALLMSSAYFEMPVTNAVNNGACCGLNFLKKIDLNSNIDTYTVIRVAKFATSLWRTINGELGGKQSNAGYRAFAVTNTVDGVCAHDSYLRCSLLCLWQCIWPNTCTAVSCIQSLSSCKGVQISPELSSDVMKMSEDELDVASVDDSLYSRFGVIVEAEIDRQKWRGNMARNAYTYKKKIDIQTVKEPTSHNLTIIKKDKAWAMGGWTASVAQQRRSKGSDGGTAVTKLRLTVKSAEQ